jgi:hypothetical protein
MCAADHCNDMNMTDDDEDCSQCTHACTDYVYYYHYATAPNATAPCEKSTLLLLLLLLRIDTTLACSFAQRVNITLITAPTSPFLKLGVLLLALSHYVPYGQSH